MTDAEPEPFTLYSTWRGLFVSTVTPVLLMALGIGAMVWAGRVAIVALAVAIIGLALGLVGLFDLPRRCVVSADGLTRRCLLRTQTLPWDNVHAITRAPGSRTFGPRPDGASRTSRSIGGLTARAGKRRYLLVDAPEGPDEYEQRARGLAAWAPGVALRAVPPPDGATPTWLYHERDRQAGHDDERGAP